MHQSILCEHEINDSEMRVGTIQFNSSKIFSNNRLLLGEEISSKFGFDFSDMKKGKCKGLWRPQNLRGKCFGLQEHGKYHKEFASIKVVPSAKHCRYLCCYLGDECINWQYQLNSNLCKLGKEPIRYGLEATGTPGWCDPMPTSSEWSGKKLVRIDENTGECVWESKILNTQCFGLGGERLNATNGRIISDLECQRSCCEAAKKGKCNIYQELNGRGCYYSKDKDIFCDDKIQGAYEGGRKCIPKFCDGNEDKILKEFKNNLKNVE